MDPSILIFLILAGVAGGFVGAQVGGGALVTLPALLFLGLTPASAVSTNILSALVINVVALFTYNHIKKLKIGGILPMALAALIGSVIGASWVLNINTEILSKTMAVLLVGVAALALFRPSGKIIPSRKVSYWFAAIPASFLLGIYGGFLSVSVTTVFVFLMMLLGQNELKAIESSVFITAVLLLGALAVFVKEDSINYFWAIPLAAGSAMGSYIGAKTALKFGETWIRILLIGISVFAAVKLLI